MTGEFRVQDEGGPLGLFHDGRYCLAEQIEVLVTCAAHPTTAAVDCTVCLPIDEEA